MIKSYPFRAVNQHLIQVYSVVEPSNEIIFLLYKTLGTKISEISHLFSVQCGPNVESIPKNIRFVIKDQINCYLCM